MWLLVKREPAPDAPYWHGRRWLAALDGVAWPLLWVLAVQQLPAPLGIVGPVVVAVALLSALDRVQRALWQNHRYRFTTWRWARAGSTALLSGLVLKWMMLN